MELSPTKKALLALRQMQSKLDTLENAKHEPITIVGMGCRLPGANNPQEFWQLLYNGKDAITNVPDERWQNELWGNLHHTQGGFVPHLKEFDPSFFRIAPREAASIDPQQRLLLEVCWEALENGAIPAEQIQGSQIGVFIGVAAIDYWHQLLSQQETEIDAYLTTGNTHSLASGRISHFFDFKGSSISLDTACSSSLVAVHLAIKSLRDRECDMALAGGVNRLISPKVSLNFSRAKMLSADSRCKTFDENADGFVRSEGSGIVVLKRLSDAIADKDNIRAILLGSATNQDGRTSSVTTPNSLSQQAVIKQALTNSRVEANQVGYLETHGTGTSLGDAIELEALSQIFKNNEKIYLGAVKTNIGHLEAAAGIASLIKTVLALENQSIPANLHLDQPNSKVEWQDLPFQLPQVSVPWATKSRIAGVSSFGFSGTNAHLVIQSADTVTTPKKSKDKPRDSYLFTISARNQKALDQLANKYIDFLQVNPDILIEDVCFTVNLGRSHFNHRLAIQVNSIADLQIKLAQYANQLESSGLWQGKANTNQRVELAVNIESPHQDLQELIESVVENPLVSGAIANVSWQIGTNHTIKNPGQQILIETLTTSQKSNWEILVNGLGQLYISGVAINWQIFGELGGGKKICLPTYPFQRSIYWL